MIVLDRGTARFNVRIAGVCRIGHHVLLHQAKGDTAWSLPGGHPEVGEQTRAALAREWGEELGLEVAVGRLLWVVENFYEDAGQRRHELGFFFDVALPAGAAELDPQRSFVRPSDAGYDLLFRWFPADRLVDVPLYPAFLRSALVDPPATPVHVVHTGDRWVLSPTDS